MPAITALLGRQLLFQDLIDLAGVGLATGRLHDFADKEAD